MSDMQHPPVPGSAQGTVSQATHASTNNRPIPSTLLRRLAEAADGAVGPAWFVGSYVLIQGKHHILGSFSSEAEAQAHVANADYGVFGPYEAPAGKGPSPIIGWDVQLQGGLSQLIGAGYDAFFWSESAIRKFALPYYANVVGPAYAMQIRDAFRNPEVMLMAHDPLTEYHMISITDSGQVKVV